MKSIGVWLFYCKHCISCIVNLTTRESLTGHTGWALPLHAEMGHSSGSFWGTASSGWSSNPRPLVPMALNIPEGHRGILNFPGGARLWFSPTTLQCLKHAIFAETALDELMHPCLCPGQFCHSFMCPADSYLTKYVSDIIDEIWISCIIKGIVFNCCQCCIQL